MAGMAPCSGCSFRSSEPCRSTEKKRENSPSVHRIPADGRNRKKERIAINILPHPGKKYCHISYPKSEQFMSRASLFPVKQKNPPGAIAAPDGSVCVFWNGKTRDLPYMVWRFQAPELYRRRTSSERRIWSMTRATQAPSRPIPSTLMAKIGQSRTHQQHGEEGDHSGHLGVTGTAQGTSQNQLGGLERLYQCHKHHDLSAQIHQ